MVEALVDNISTSLEEDDNNFKKQNVLWHLYYTLNSMYTICSSSETCTGCNLKKSSIHYINCAIEKVISEWDVYIQFLKSLGTMDNNLCCDYVIHWLYGKIKENGFNIDELNSLYGKVEKHLKGKCDDKTKSDEFYMKFVKDYDIEVIKDKKRLYDFVEYYDNIKNILNNNDDLKKGKYCNYIELMFKLYKKMKRNNLRLKYNKEIDSFEKKFKINNTELTHLKSKCPEKELDLEFKEENNALLQLKQAKSESCEIGNILTSNTSPYKGHTYENVLKTLYSYNVYDKLNASVAKNEYCSVCKEVEVLEKNYPGITQLCQKIARNLKKKLEDIQDKEKSESDRCLYLIHWTYDEAGKLFNGNKNKIHEIPFFPNLLKISSSINYELMREDILENSKKILSEFDIRFKAIQKGIGNSFNLKKNTKDYEKLIKERFVSHDELGNYKPCFYSFDCNIDECKEMKELFDYFKNYDTFKCNNDSKKTECKIHCEYLIYINKLYEKHIEECCTCFFRSNECRDNCPHYFKCDQKYNPYTLFSALKCNDILPSGMSMQKINKPISVDRDFIIKSEKSSITGFKNISRDPFNIVMSVAFTLLGIFFLFFCSIKFTPFGPWLYNKVLKTEKNKYDTYERHSQELLKNDSEYNNTNSQNRRLRITYQSTDNSVR
ncbi:Plasmodium vivax Vir protein, putative [Plasmodium ovale]|uniref:Plasmodium vivax Vir protein, putative n=1 Tax=Plasmodium ovale TaxID=36330 RepID=A0A1C3KL54_PLAOA|nr:Plasmodium vivax Vir protein, putative [Plasmodium ovale]